MTIRFLLIFVFIVLCVPCFAEEKMPTVPELIKKMCDYRMAIDNMRAEVTVTYPIHTRQPIAEKVKEHYYFAYNNGRVRCDRTVSSSVSPRTQFYQYLSTPDFYFTRHTSPTDSHLNDGNSLFVRPPLDRPFQTFDLRRIGTDPCHSGRFRISEFNCANLMQRFYSQHNEGHSVTVDIVDGEKLYKVSSFQVISEGIVGLTVFWINPHKGYNLVRFEAGVEKYDHRESYTVTLGKFTSRKGEIWFPSETFYRYEMGNIITTEKLVLDHVDFDAQDETPFTFAGLGIPIGYRVAYLDEERPRTWNGTELVGDIPYSLEPISLKDRKVFWIVNGIGFALIALALLIRWIKLLRRRST